MSATPRPPTDLRDPSLVAIELTEVKGRFELLSSQVSQGIGNLTSQVSAMQGEFREQGRILRSVEQAQHDMQAHSQAVERIAKAIEVLAAENMGWRKDHEVENRVVADRVTSFRGAVVGFSVLSGVAFTVAMNWITSEFSGVRKEAADRTIALAEKRAAIESTHASDVAQIRSAIAEIRAQERNGGK